MPIHHVHVGAVSVEPNELERAITEPSVVVARHRHVRRQAREAAGSAREALRHLIWVEWQARGNHSGQATTRLGTRAGYYAVALASLTADPASADPRSRTTPFRTAGWL